jgi:pilus assembly protein CpaC
MAISGQEGSFLAGGKVLIPVSQGGTVGGASTITLEEKEFGVGVRFMPTVLAGGVINLRVTPEVSEFSSEGLAVTAPGVNGRAIVPLITTRRASTTVQLMDGQSFVIGGLIKNNTTTNIKAFPVLGEIPILGALFRSTAFQSDRSEVLFVVTPRLVKPLGGPVALPTDAYVPPSRQDLFLNGRMEGAPATPAAPATQGEAPKDAAPTGFVVK